MRLTTKFSAYLAVLTGLAVIVTLFGASLSFYMSVQTKSGARVQAVATMVDNQLFYQTPEQLGQYSVSLMIPSDITRFELLRGDQVILDKQQIPPYHAAHKASRDKVMTVALIKHPGMSLRLTYHDPAVEHYQSLMTMGPLTIAIGFMVLVVFFSSRWVKRQLRGQEMMELRAERILRGERGKEARGSIMEWPYRTSLALDRLLDELQEAGARRHRVDTLIRSYAAQDDKTGLSNRLFFDNQLATMLDDHEGDGMHGVVMLIRLPDADVLRDSWGEADVEEVMFRIVNVIASFITRYPGALLARYFRNDFAVLLPHRTLKEADSIAGQLVKQIDALPSTRIVDRDNMLHIGVCAWRSGQSTEQVIENAGEAVRHAALQGGNGWAVYDSSLPEKGRGNVRWRTLIELTLQSNGPRFYQKPAVMQDGHVHHRDILCRIADGDQEVIAAEYILMVRQFGLSEPYDRLVISRVLPLLAIWPEETFAVSISVESLIRDDFQGWLRDTLMQCERSRRQRLILELEEADVSQHSERLHRIVRLIKALGTRVAVSQAGLTVVSSAYIQQLGIEFVKLHPVLVRNIDRRTENKLFVQSLVEACNDTKTQVFASGVRTNGEWQTLLSCGVSGAQGDFFAKSMPLDLHVKKYLQRYSV
ncbi:RNase E specificity factor CsrD [Shimwellia pseudoproteus]|uniref:RNase E specificity factor CsrD n=1 Tax=Shimwellia pseudoproteus TaxID=570012 RepID=UPI0018EAA287|nr:RNase E specificity factor CsrD [Shimwellia pseudoproteus]MBJ3814904.1 RNase E specificity factor CsrD [Shimwellia pseudoproteus]